MLNTNRLTRLLPPKLSQHVPQRTSTNLYFQTEEACAEGSGMTKKRGIVIGVYSKGCGDYTLTSLGKKIDVELGGRLNYLAKKVTPGFGKAVVLNNLGEQFYGIAIAAVGPEGLGYNESETLNECKENIRIAAGVGAQALQEMGVSHITVDGFTNSEAAAEGSQLGVWKYQVHKNPQKKSNESVVDIKQEDLDKAGWMRGKVKADGQNIARMLSEVPANEMTPSKFAQAALEILCPHGISVDIRDRDWMETKNFRSFISVGKTSCEPPLLLELSYNGGGDTDKPVAFVGVGHTFDCGGLCLKRCKNMKDHRADMAGAAVIIGLMRNIALLGLPVNVNALIPLSENMPGGMAVKPGDVVFALNGKTIRIQDSSRQSRVQVADTLAYTAEYKPCLVINIGTISSGVIPSLGEGPSAVFSTSDMVWSELKRAGAETGDRVWRLPLWRYYCNRVTEHRAVDLNNVGNVPGGDSCIGAAFLLNFAPPVDFACLDISATGKVSSGLDFPYLRKGFMTGRPTRTLTQFMEQLACPDEPSRTC